MAGPAGIEPTPSGSKPEILSIELRTDLMWSGIRGSNSRPIPWQGIALPTELIPHIV